MTTSIYNSSFNHKPTIFKKREKVLLGLSLIFVVFFYCIVIILYYGSFYSEISDMYLTNYFLSVITIIIVVRILISSYAAYFIVKIWLSKNSRKFTDLPFIFGYFFFLFIPAKLMDLLVFTTYRLYADYGFSYYLLLFIHNLIEL